MHKSQDISYFGNFMVMKKYVLEILFNAESDDVEYIQETLNDYEEDMRDYKFELSPETLWLIDRLEILKEIKPKEYTTLISLALANGNLIGCLLYTSDAADE